MSIAIGRGTETGSFVPVSLPVNDPSGAGSRGKSQSLTPGTVRKYSPGGEGV